MAARPRAEVCLEAPEWPPLPASLRRERDGRSVYTRPGSRGTPPPRSCQPRSGAKTGAISPELARADAPAQGRRLRGAGAGAGPVRSEDLSPNGRVSRPPAGLPRTGSEVSGCRARNDGAGRYRPCHAAHRHARARPFQPASGHRRRQLRAGRRVRPAAGGAARHVGSGGHGAPRDGPRPGRQRLSDGGILLAGRRAACRIRDGRVQLPARVQLQARRRAGPVGPGTRVTGVGPAAGPAAGLEPVA